LLVVEVFQSFDCPISSVWHWLRLPSCSEGINEELGKQLNFLLFTKFTLAFAVNCTNLVKQILLAYKPRSRFLQIDVHKIIIKRN
jgi:phage baseplate assembly protein W